MVSYWFISLANAHDHFAVDILGKPKVLIVRNCDEMRAQLARLFKVRHVVVHESPRDPAYEPEEIDSFLEAGLSFMRACHETFGALVHVTQLDLNTRGNEILSQAESEMNGVYRDVEVLATQGGLNGAAGNDREILKQTRMHGSGIATCRPPRGLGTCSRVTGQLRGWSMRTSERRSQLSVPNGFVGGSIAWKEKYRHAHVALRIVPLFGNPRARQRRLDGLERTVSSSNRRPDDSPLQSCCHLV